MKLKIPFGEKILLFSVLFSILFSVYLYFIENNKEAAIFVGIWAPTIMSITNYINLKFSKKDEVFIPSRKFKR